MSDPAVSPMLSASKAQRCRAVMAAMMAPGERLLALADVTSVSPLSIGLAVTDQRIVAVPKGPRTPVELQVHRGQLRDVRFDKRLLFTYLIGITGDGEHDFGIALSGDRAFLQPFLDQLLAPTAPTSPPTAPTPPPTAGISLVKKRPEPATPATEPTIADELVKLADLHQRGLLTDEEFQSAKAAVIKGSP